MPRSRNLADLDKERAARDARSAAANDDTPAPEKGPSDLALKKLAALVSEEAAIRGKRDSASKAFADQLKKIRKQINSIAEQVNSGQTSFVFDEAEGEPEE